MLRRAHRTLIAKFCAACLIVFAASPVTAPFTTIDLSDFTRSHPSDTGHHPGRQMATLRVRVAAHAFTSAGVVQTVQHVASLDLGRAVTCVAAPTCVRADLRTVLRL